MFPCQYLGARLPDTMMILELHGFRRFYAAIDFVGSELRVFEQTNLDICDVDKWALFVLSSRNLPIISTSVTFDSELLTRDRVSKL